MNVCSLCGRRFGTYVKELYLKHYGYKNLRLCKECDLGVMEQIWDNLWKEEMK